jgi:hypothetical protein
MRRGGFFVLFADSHPALNCRLPSNTRWFYCDAVAKRRQVADRKRPKSANGARAATVYVSTSTQALVFLNGS